MQTARGSTPGEVKAIELGMARSTWFRLERGEGRPAPEIAIVLARWLGWSLEQVYEAAKPALLPRETLEN